MDEEFRLPETPGGLEAREQLSNYAYKLLTEILIKRVGDISNPMTGKPFPVDELRRVMDSAADTMKEINADPTGWEDKAVIMASLSSEIANTIRLSTDYIEAVEFYALGIYHLGYTDGRMDKVLDKEAK